MVATTLTQASAIGSRSADFDEHPPRQTSGGESQHPPREVDDEPCVPEPGVAFEGDDFGMGSVANSSQEWRHFRGDAVTLRLSTPTHDCCDRDGCQEDGAERTFTNRKHVPTVSVEKS